MSGLMSVDGLVSGFDTTEIIDKMMAVERRSVTLLEARQARANTQLAAFRALNSELLAFQTSARTLARPAAFRAKTVSVSDETVLTATAGSAAVSGSYALTVNGLAAAHEIASQGFADTDLTTVGTGTLQIQVGDGETVTIDVTTANNTLAGLRDAINNSDAEVTASILNDGSDAVPYRLLLTADQTGAANTIATTADLSGGTAPEFTANAISDVVAEATNAYAGTATSGGTYTGTGNKTYLVEIVEGGDLATATYRVSEDDGTTWGSTQALAGGTIDVYDDQNSADLGVDASFTDEAFAAGDQFIIDAFVPTVQEAADAELAVGSGTGQISIASSSNTVTDVLPGLTLNLAKADPTTTVNVTLEPDTDGIKQNIQSFVDRYNDVVDFIREQTRYDAESGEAGVLLGNTAVMKIQQDLRRAALGTVPGLQDGLDGLYAVGVSVSSLGKLSVDTSALEAALSSDLDAVAQIFQNSGESTNAKVDFVAATGDTEATTAGYEVHITQAARRGTLTGAAIPDPAVGGLTIDASNDKLVLEVNDVATSVLTLSHKTYQSGVELANEVAAKIADSEQAVAPVEVIWADEGTTGHLEVRTVSYGSGYTVELGDNPANSAAAALGLAGGTATAGQEVAGTIDGYEAQGSGRILEATDASSPARGLSVDVALTEAEVGTGVTSLVTVVKGVAKQAQDLLDYLTDPVSGYLKGKEDRYNNEVERYADQIERKEELLAQRRERLVARFVELEKSLASLQSQSQFLSSQLLSLQQMGSGLGNSN
ncbi:MAG: flagellar filament capping protein FliD [Planctomycetota bacterium]